MHIWIHYREDNALLFFCPWSFKLRLSSVSDCILSEFCSNYILVNVIPTLLTYLLSFVPFASSSSITKASLSANPPNLFHCSGSERETIVFHPVAIGPRVGWRVTFVTFCLFLSSILTLDKVGNKMMIVWDGSFSFPLFSNWIVTWT